MWKVLVIDDNKDDRKTLIEGLKNIARCHEAQTGDEALQIYATRIKENKSYDFILLDVQMPGLNGFDVLRSIREIDDKFPDKETKDPSVIMITTYKDSLMDKYNMGWDEFITKPVDVGILIEHMKRLSQN